MKRKLWLGFGAIASIALPISTLVACDNDDPTEEEIGIEKVKKMTGKKLVDAIPGSLYGKTNDVKDSFVENIAVKNSSGYWNLKEQLLDGDYKNAIDKPEINLSDEAKELLNNILKSTNNNEKLASAIILFTFYSADAQMKQTAELGLLNPTNDEKEELWNEITKSSLYYKDIAKAMMIKFSGQSKLPWNLPFINGALEYDESTKTFTEGNTKSIVIPFLGGSETVKTILEASGYKYIIK